MPAFFVGYVYIDEHVRRFMARILQPFVSGLATGIPSIAYDFMFDWYLEQDYHIDTLQEVGQ